MAEVNRVCAVLAVALLVGAGFGPSVGVAFGTGSPSDESFVSGTLSRIPDPTTGTDNDTDDGVKETTLALPTPTSNETSVRRTPDPTTRETSRDTAEETTGSTPTERPTTTDVSIPTTTDVSIPTTTDVSMPTTTELPDRTTAETTRSRTTGDEGDAEDPPGRPSDPGGPPDGTPGVGSPGNGAGPPDDSWNGPGSGVGRTPGHDGPPSVGGGNPPSAGHGEPPSRGDANRTGPPANRIGPPANRTGPPENRTGRPSNSTERPGNRTGGPNVTGPPGGESPDVNVTVENATANASVSVNVSSSAERDGVSFSSVNVTPTRNGSFSLNVTASENPIAGKTPSVELSNASQPLGYLSVDHSIADESVSNVTFTFRVRTDRVNASERDEIALYRFHGGTWNELPTTLVRTTDAHYVYRVRSPGLSEFAAGKQRPQFEITDATAAATALSVGEPLRVQVRVANRGEADGTFTAELVLDGESVARRQLTIAADGMRQTTFERGMAESGTYEVFVDDYWVGEVTVNGTDDGSTTATSADAAPTDGWSDRDAHDDATGSDAHDDATESDAADRTNDSVDAGTMSAFGFWAAAAAFLAGLVARRR